MTFQTRTQVLERLHAAWRKDPTALPDSTYLVKIAERAWLVDRRYGVKRHDLANAVTFDCEVELREDATLVELANKPSKLVRMMAFRKLKVNNKQAGLQLAHSLKALLDAA